MLLIDLADFLPMPNVPHFEPVLFRQFHRWKESLFAYHYFLPFLMVKLGLMVIIRTTLIMSASWNEITDPHIYPYFVSPVPNVIRQSKGWENIILYSLRLRLGRRLRHTCRICRTALRSCPLTTLYTVPYWSDAMPTCNRENGRVSEAATPWAFERG